MSNLYYDLPIELQRKIELLRPTHPLAKLIQDAMIISPADIYAEFDREVIAEIDWQEVVVADVPPVMVEEAIEVVKKEMRSADEDLFLDSYYLQNRSEHMQLVLDHITAIFFRTRAEQLMDIALEQAAEIDQLQEQNRLQNLEIARLRDVLQA